MNAVENQVRDLVAVELAAANEKFPQFHSQHEGWAVMMEEIVEMRDEIENIDISHNAMFYSIMHDHSAANDAERVRDSALRAACESIQVAAMAQKFLYMMEMEDNT